MNELSEILKPLNTSGKKKTLKLGHTYPHGVNRQYTADMRKLVSNIASQVKKTLLPEIKQQIKARNGERNDSLVDILATIGGISNTMFPGEKMATEFANKTYKANEKNISNSIKKSAGIAIALPVGNISLTEDWVAENTLLIKDLQEQYINRISKSVSAGYRQGKTYTSIAKSIQRETGITWRRAKTISTDQIGSLNGQIAKKRNEELGVATAKWRTAGDERVRGNPSGLYPNAIPSHFKRNNQTFKWSEGIGGEFPGGPIRCRCFAESIIEY